MGQKNRRSNGRFNRRSIVCALAASLVFGMTPAQVKAAEIAAVLPSAGVDFALASNATSLKAMQEEAEAAIADVSAVADPALASPAASSSNTQDASQGTAKDAGISYAEEADQAADKVIEETKVADTSGLSEAVVKSVAQKLDQKDEEEGFKNLVIAKVNDYVNVRSLPSEEGEILGKLYDKSVGSFLEEENGWYKITSGSVTGYVKGEYCVTGEEAVSYAKEVGKRIATVTTTTLKVRAEAGLDAPVIGLVPIEDHLIVVEELEGWVKVNVEEGDGYVSRDYVTLTTEFVKAESKAEEEARLAREEAERRAAREAAARAARGSKSSQKEQVVYASGGGSQMGRSVANFALQFVGNPYVYGGTSLTNGADCSGFVMSVYANFGVSLPHSSAADRSVGTAVDGLANAQPGDIVCYSGHVGIYIGNGQIVHASTAKTGIIVSSASYRTPLSVRRIF